MPSRPPALNIQVTECGPEAAEEVHRVTQLAFAQYGRLTPPSGALKETVGTVRRDLEQSGGALARLADRGRVVGALRLVSESRYLLVRRVAVDPAFQRHGVGTALMDWAREEAGRRGHREIQVRVRGELPGNRSFYERLGYQVIGEHPFPNAPHMVWLEMACRFSYDGLGLPIEAQS
jgi:tRNA threonylcarbamoyladenosine biosynthesis protein TsaE